MPGGISYRKTDGRVSFWGGVFRRRYVMTIPRYRCLVVTTLTHEGCVIPVLEWLETFPDVLENVVVFLTELLVWDLDRTQVSNTVAEDHIN
ncbi:hypothetical protein J6590_009302 [Homalodisca vitripennis]|nr:hypothetical protein J6590_009302 [Homalodisca vitripennis]